MVISCAETTHVLSSPTETLPEGSVKTVYALGPRGQIPTWAVGLRETKTPGAGGAQLKDLRGALEQRSLVERVFV